MEFFYPVTFVKDEDLKKTRLWQVFFIFLQLFINVINNKERKSHHLVTQLHMLERLCLDITPALPQIVLPKEAATGGEEAGVFRVFQHGGNQAVQCVDGGLLL